MLLTLLILIVSLYLLVKGSDIVVDEVASLARYFHISSFVVGLTIVAVGTSLPELSTNIFSVLRHTPEIGFGNILGSNLFNLGINMALGFLLLTTKIDKKYFQKDAVFLFVITSLFLLLALNGVITRLEGFLFLVIFCYYLYHLMKYAPKPVAKEMKLYAKEKSTVFFNRSFFTTITYLSLGCVALIFGARFLISAVVDLSKQVGISQQLIAITLVAFGTALPELFVTINATRKGLADVFLGNILGSNITNLLLILGLAALLRPLPLTSFDIFVGLPSMLFLTFLFVHYLLSRKSTRLSTGIFLLLSYILFVFSLFFFSSIV